MLLGFHRGVQVGRSSTKPELLRLCQVAQLCPEVVQARKGDRQVPCLRHVCGLASSWDHQSNETQPRQRDPSTKLFSLPKSMAFSMRGPPLRSTHVNFPRHPCLVVPRTTHSCLPKNRSPSEWVPDRRTKRPKPALAGRALSSTSCGERF